MGKEYTRKEVGEHKTAESLWIIISNNVYDVTKYMDEHPGGEDILLENAGKDATEDFTDVGHSSDAKKLMKKYKIGEIVAAERK